MLLHIYIRNIAAISKFQTKSLKAKNSGFPQDLDILGTPFWSSDIFYLYNKLNKKRDIVVIVTYTELSIFIIW